MIAAAAAAMIVASTLAATEPAAAADPAATPKEAAERFEANVTLTEAQYQQMLDEGKLREAGKTTPPAVSKQQTAQRSTAVDTATPHEPALPPATAERQARQAAAQEAATSTDEVTVTAAPAIGDTPDQALVDQCMTDDAEDGFGRIMNRFVYCKRFETSVSFWRYPLGIPVLVGRNEFTLELFAHGDDHDRRIRTFARVQEGSVDYDVWSPFERLFVAPYVPLELIANCVEDFNTCAATRGPVTLPFVVWDNSDDWYYWDIRGQESAGVGRDKISYAQWYVQFRGLGPGVPDPGHSAYRQIRCDSADYFRLGAGVYPMACIHNEVTPHLTMSRSDLAIGEVARHIDLAQLEPNRTYPLLVPLGFPVPRDKVIPGRYIADDAAAPGLHRIREAVDPEYQANRDHVRGACYKEGPNAAEYADTGLPERPDTTVDQCDEYPMASTLEGAAHPDWDFSVRAVAKKANSDAGNLVRDYYVNDRILSVDFTLPLTDNDRYYVNIVD
ncbi:NucA/NucB deoxyribonuclease domain-containing protein [Actinoplanes couchii]|uniref:Deoxyribonuclease NucA/NucB domain-containing protein n=1 Tax=Actinoplanes couchii TaxID=403638 RepID=A0ABQ3XQT1_9ACTN|nr:hypothetical protein [Actinoplanes couchii]MDR6318817.1 hypothetical protein [Actinoplanes couchii]GID60848.1 hypothetical protein Aco03nite_092520 [Actinoplanes couchii]